jgi:hypothetical protein
MFDPREDPLGVGLKYRAHEKRLADWAENPALVGLRSPLGEDWDAFFQAADEASGGMPNFAGATDASTPVDPNADLGTLFAAHSNQLKGFSDKTGYAGHGVTQMPSLSMDALKKLRTGKK